MDLKVTKVTGQGDEKKEYVTIRANKDCNLKGYIVFDDTFNEDGSKSNKHRHIFIFPDREVKKDDRIFLRTRAGKDSRGLTKTGTPAHRFHWGLNSPVWNEDGDTVHLIKIQGQQDFKVVSNKNNV